MKTYQQHCGVARSLDLLGGRWTLLIVRELLLGPTRYSALLGGLRGITTNLLADRLQALQAGGLVERCHDADERGERARRHPSGRWCLDSPRTVPTPRPSHRRSRHTLRLPT